MNIGAPANFDINGIYSYSGLEKSQLKLNLYQPVVLIDFSHFSPAKTNFNRLKLLIVSMTINGNVTSQITAATNLGVLLKFSSLCFSTANIR